MLTKVLLFPTQLDVGYVYDEPGKHQVSLRLAEFIIFNSMQGLNIRPSKVFCLSDLMFLKLN